MVFSSLEFIFLFLPIFFGCYYLTPNKEKNYVLMIGSLSFYFIGAMKQPEYFILFLLSILVDYNIALWMEKNPGYKKTLLYFGFLFHISCLAIFKYFDFIFGEIKKIKPDLDLCLDIVLPIGISFYTFQGISYLVDVYREKEKAEQSLLRFIVYIAMFEQLIAGPIVTYGRVKKELGKRTITGYAIYNGIGAFLFGLGLKVLLANPLGKLWTQTCAIGFESISTPLAWMAIAAFSFQIYFDFFGYSLMAMGLGEMLGFHLPKNFDHPYTSLTMTEFWRKWHITLGDWFREYVYIPLGGNQNGNIATIRNLFLVWLLTGIWHGAGYHFIMWGLTLFFILTLEKFLWGKYLKKVPLFGHLYMLLLISLTWTIFAIDDIGQIVVFWTRLFPFFGKDMWSEFRYDYVKYFNQYYPFLLAGFLFSTRVPYQLLKCVKGRVIHILFLLIIFCASVYCMYRGYDDPFLYFQF